MAYENYEFHQTPEECAKDLIKLVPITSEDILFEPFRGEGAFYNNFPESNPKIWSEIMEGIDYKDINQEYDWVISNPPFKVVIDNKKIHSWDYIDYFSQRARKGIAFLINDNCFRGLTTKRLHTLKERGWSITSITVCNIKKWFGRYYWIIVERKESNFFNYLLPNY